MSALLLRAASAAFLFTAFPAAAESSAPLTWTTCHAPAMSPTVSPGDIASRTECARLAVPRDYARPEAGTLSLEVVRVVAAGERGERHDGTLFLQPDEFAETIHRSLPSMASAWLAGDESWRDVARRLDLVGLAPRRMDDAGGNDCISATTRLPRHASLGADPSASNVTAAENLARSIATACQNDPMHAHIGMRPRIEDMERLREALGQPKLHLLGIGHGAWVATHYAARYPGNVGRMLLDGSWDADGSIVEAVEARVHERGRTIRSAMSTLVAEPERYGRGTDAGVVYQQLATWSGSGYSTWTRRIDSADALSALLSAGHPPTSGADEVDDPYGFGPSAARVTPAIVASAFAARCNDGYWGRSRAYWRERTRELRDMWPFGLDNETFQGMVCSEWPAAFAPTAVPMLDRVPPFLMLHAEFDAEAPLRNAAMMLQGHDNASMVVARGLRAHGVVMRTDRPCVASAAGRYLADGILPGAKLTNCRLPTPKR